MYGSEYQIVTKKDSKTLIVVFSAINFPKGKFGFYNFFSDVDANVLFVNSPGNQWFQQDIDYLYEVIRNNKKELGINKMFYYGSSMGAYGALLLSILANDGPCLAYGPNIQLGLTGSHSNRYNIDFDERFKDLSKLEVSGEYAINVVFGAFDAVDAFYYFNNKAIMEKVNFQIISSCHACHQHLANLGYIKNLRDEFLKTGTCKPETLLSYRVDSFEDIKNLKTRNYNIWSGFIQGDEDLEKLFLYDLSDFFYQARIFQKSGCHKEAIDLISIAISRIYRDTALSKLPSEYIGRYFFLRAESLRRTRQSELAIEDYNNCLKQEFETKYCKTIIKKMLSIQ